MKLAIVGPRCPLAQQFLSYLAEEEHQWELSFFHLSDRSPLIEFRDQEYPTRRLCDELLHREDFDAYLFFPQEDYRDMMLAIEAKGYKVIDCTATFVNEATVPLVLPPMNHQLIHSTNLLCMPSPATALLMPILYGLDQRFRLKRVSVITHDRKASNQLFLANEYSDEEINSINEVSKILDNDSIRFTTSHLEERPGPWKDFYFNIEFARPFNVEELLSQLHSTGKVYSQRDVSKEILSKELILRRYRRDLSLDSGIHMWISTQDTKRPLFRGIYSLLKEIQTG